MSETVNFGAMPHEVTISSYLAHVDREHAVRKVFPTEAEAIAFAETVVPEELRPEGRSCRYDEVVWVTCHIEWCVSISLHMPSLVTTKSTKPTIRERFAYWGAAIADRFAPELPAGHIEYDTVLERGEKSRRQGNRA